MSAQIDKIEKLHKLLDEEYKKQQEQKKIMDNKYKKLMKKHKEIEYTPITLKNTGYQVKRIYHLADIHIRKSSRADEYREVFDNLHTLLKQDKNEKSLIVICGDIMHEKCTYTPQSLNLLFDFMEKLTDISDVLIILGNHDGSTLNKNTVDGLKFLLDKVSIKKNNIFCPLYSGVYIYENLVFGISSVMDKKIVTANQVRIKNKIKIALYHGQVSGSSFQNGYSFMTDCIHKSNFDGYEYTLLGDTHKFQFIDNNRRICYPSSLIQQNHGEDIFNHGMVRWDLNRGKGTLIRVKNNYGYMTIYIDNNKIEGRIENGVLINLPANLPPNLRLRVKYKDTTIEQCKILIKDIPRISLEFDQIITNKEETVDLDNIKDMILDIGYQNKQIAEYCKERSKSKEIIEGVQKLNGIMNGRITVNDHKENKNWKLKKLVFENMLAYGPDNTIDFEKMKGVINVDGENFDGKSSLFDIILYCLYEKCSREVSGKWIMNNKNNNFKCELYLQIGNNSYRIKRYASSKKKFTNIQTLRVSVSIEKQEGNTYRDISGVSKIETNKKIIDLVGDYDDILLTNIMLQESKETNFINYQKADRIDFLIKHSSLHIFDKLHNESKISLKKLKQELYATNKGLEKYNSSYNDKIKDYKVEISQLTEEKNNLTKRQKTIKSDLSNLFKLGGKGINIIKMDDDYKQTCDRINKLQEEQTDLVTTKDKLDQQNIQELKDNYKTYVSEKEYEKKKLEEDNIKKEYEKSNKKYNEPIIRKAIDKLDIKINKINKIIEDEEGKKFEFIPIPREKEIEEKYNELIELRKEIKKLEEDERIQNKELQSLKKVVDEYKNYKYDPKCKFCVKNKHTIRSEDAKKKYKILENKHTKLQDQIFEKELNFDKLKNFEKLYNNLEESKEHNINLHKKKKESEEVLEKNREMLEFYNSQLHTKKEKINKIEKNKDIDKEINSNNSKIEELEKEIEERGKLMEDYKTMKNKMKNVNTRLPIIKFELDSLIEKKNTLEIDLKRYKNVRNVAEKINTNEDELEKITNKLDRIRQRLIELNCSLANLNEKMNEKRELEKNKKEFELAISVYEEYKLIMSRTGIRFKLIEKLLREIEMETNKILGSIVPFNIRLERVENIQSNSEKTKEIIIYKDSDGIYQPIGNGSTSEGYLTALAIRLVLLKILDRPRPNFMFIDEGFSCLDSTNQEKIGVIFNLINKLNDFSLVVTHHDNIKSLCNNSIKIEKNNGLSKIVF
mgnify:CR=1 FL=1